MRLNIYNINNNFNKILSIIKFKINYLNYQSKSFYYCSGFGAECGAYPGASV